MGDYNLNLSDISVFREEVATMKKFAKSLTLFLMAFYLMSIPVNVCFAEEWTYVTTQNGLTLYFDEDSGWYNNSAKQGEAKLKIIQFSTGRYFLGNLHLDYIRWCMSMNGNGYERNGKRIASAVSRTAYASEDRDIYEFMVEFKEHYGR